MNQSQSGFHQQVAVQESNPLLNSELTEKKRIESIGYCLDRASAICFLLLSCFHKTSQVYHSDKTIYHSFKSIALELSQIKTFIESSEKKEKLARIIGYQLDMASTAIGQLLPYFEAISLAEPDDVTIYKKLSNVTMELADLDKSLDVYTEVYGQA